MTSGNKRPLAVDITEKGREAGKKQCGMDKNECRLSFELGPGIVGANNTQNSNDPLELYLMLRTQSATADAEIDNGDLHYEYLDDIKDSQSVDNENKDVDDEEDDEFLFRTKSFELCLELFKQQELDDDNVFSEFMHGCCCIDFGRHLAYYDEMLLRGREILTRLIPRAKGLQKHIRLRRTLAALMLFQSYCSRSIDPMILVEDSGDQIEDILFAKDKLDLLQSACADLLLAAGAIQSELTKHDSSEDVLLDSQQVCTMFQSDHIILVYFLNEILHNYGEYLTNGPEDQQSLLLAVLDSSVKFLEATADASFPINSIILFQQHRMGQLETISVDELITKISSLSSAKETSKCDYLKLAAQEAMGHLLMEKSATLPDSDEDAVLDCYERAMQTFTGMIPCCCNLDELPPPVRRVIKYLRILQQENEEDSQDSFNEESNAVGE